MISPVLREFRLRVALREMFVLADLIEFDFDLDPTIKRAREADTSGLTSQGGTP